MIAKLFRILPYARHHKANLIAIVIMTIATSAITVLQPWPMKILVDFALGDIDLPTWLSTILDIFSLEPKPGVLIMIAGGTTLILFAISSALNAGISWGWMAAGQRMVYELATDLYAHLLRLSMIFHSSRSVGDNLDRLMTDTWVIYRIVSGLLVSPIQSVITLVGIGFVAWHLNPLLTVLTFSVSPVLACSVIYFGPLLKRRAKRTREAQARLVGFVHQTMTSIPLVQAFDADQRNMRQFGNLVDDAVNASQHGVLVNRSFSLVNGLAQSLGFAIVFFYGGLDVLGGRLSIGSLLVFLAYIRTLQSAFQQLLWTIASLKSSEASFDRLYEIFDTNEIVTEVPEPQEIPSSITPNRGVEIKFDKVTFGYKPERPVLHEISFEVSSGETIALVGPTGAGKSTLASLLLRFCDPSKGQIFINGIDIQKTALDNLRAQISIVPQDAFLLPLSVSDNIAYGCPGANQKQILDAAIAANAHEFIIKLPKGYDSILGERGATLSGGQKQRLSIARALVRNSPLVILDEPTSALDIETETQLLEALKVLAKGRTTIIIAHRLSTIRNADRIIVLNQGRVEEVGRHEDLIANRGLYEQLYKLQHGNADEKVPI